MGHCIDPTDIVRRFRPQLVAGENQRDFAGAAWAQAATGPIGAMSGHTGTPAGTTAPGQCVRRRRMARPATGTIETHEWRDGRTVTVRVRLRAYGRRYRIDFGTNHAQCLKRKRIDHELVWTLMRFPDEPGNPIARTRR